MNRRSLTLGAFGCAVMCGITMLAIPSLVVANEIDTLSSWDGWTCVPGALGEPLAGYTGQSFLALGDQVDSISFMLDGQDDASSIANDATEFRLLLTPLAATGDRPDFDDVLFESRNLTTSLNSGFELFTVPIGISVVPGVSYMWVLDAFVLFDGEEGFSDIAANTFGKPDAYIDGEFFFYSVDKSSPGVRSNHDDEAWWTYGTGRDAAFRVSFTPEPHSWLLTASIAGFCCIYRRRTIG